MNCAWCGKEIGPERTIIENQNLAAKLNAIGKSGICIGKWIPMRAKPLRMTIIKGIARRRETDAMTEKPRTLDQRKP